MTDEKPPLVGGLLAPNRLAKRILTPRSRVREVDPLILVLATSRSIIGVALLVSLAVAADERGQPTSAPPSSQVWHQQIWFYGGLALASLLITGVLALVRPAGARRLVGSAIASLQILAVYGVLLAVIHVATGRAAITDPKALFVDEAVAAVLVWVSLVTLAAQIVYIPQNFFRSAEGHPALSPLLALVAAGFSLLFFGGGNLPAPPPFATVIAYTSFVSNVALAALELWRIRRPLPHNDRLTRWAGNLVARWNSRQHLTAKIAKRIGYGRAMAGMVIIALVSIPYAALNTWAMVYEPDTTTINPGFYNYQNQMAVAGLNVGLTLVPLFGIYLVWRYRVEGIFSDPESAKPCDVCHGSRVVVFAGGYPPPQPQPCPRCHGYGVLDAYGQPRKPEPEPWSNRAVAFFFLALFAVMCFAGSILGERVAAFVK